MTGKAILYEGLGGPEIITITDREVRMPAAGEVRIRVKAAAVNPTDVWLRTFENKQVQFPVVPGMDAAGVIEATGPAVTRLKVGDEVMAVVTPYRPDGGAQATYIVAPAASVVLKPQSSTFAQAACLPMNGLTALRALELSGLQAGQVLAVSGGAGLVAHYTIALAKRRGLIVIADAKKTETDLVRSYGADIVIAREDDFAAAVRREFEQGAHAVIDTAALGSRCLAAIRDGGVYVHVRYLTDKPDVRNILCKLVWVPDVIARTEWLEQLKEMVDQGHITLRVAGEYPPAQVAAAQEALSAGGLRGRPVVIF